MVRRETLTIDSGESAVDALFAVERECDVLVHAAGFTRDKLMMMMPERDFDDVLGVHLKGAFLTAKQAMKPMISRRWGRIVLVVSPALRRLSRAQAAAADSVPQIAVG